MALTSISMPNTAPVAETFNPNGGHIHAQAMFFAQVLADDGETVIPIIRLIDTGTVDVSASGTIRPIWIWSKDKKAGDHSRYYWDQIVSQVELDLKEDGIVLTDTAQTGYEVWSCLTNMLSRSLHDQAKSIVNYAEFRKIVEKDYVISNSGESVTKIRKHIKFWTHSDGTSKLPVFEWKRTSDTFELIINNKGVRYQDNYPLVYLICEASSSPTRDSMKELKQWFFEKNYVDIEVNFAKQCNQLYR